MTATPHTPIAATSVPHAAAEVCRRVGIVVIGRNEGERLKTCLRAVVGRAAQIVYVDSGSTDGSVAFAQSLGVETVDLDLTQPFTAARARNAGFARLIERASHVEFVQFVDGDCELVAGWLTAGVAALDADPQNVIVFGRVRERFPTASVYNRMCDLEWDGPVGEVASCGGIALMRVAAVQAAGGFNPQVIAGEEPELCVRLRAAGGRVQRIAVEMTLHDADMHHFWQWWRRARRAGHAYAEGAWRHGRRTGHGVRRTLSILFWGGGLPLLAVVLAWPTRGITLALLVLCYAYLGWRVYRHERRRASAADARLLAAFTMLAKFAQFGGVCRFAWRTLLRREAKLIEHKVAVARQP